MLNCTQLTQTQTHAIITVTIAIAMIMITNEKIWKMYLLIQNFSNGMNNITIVLYCNGIIICKNGKIL